ncbi:hypothetical protein BH10BAC6_BH10BAC6_06660 [soil metagenome]
MVAGKKAHDGGLWNKGAIPVDSSCVCEPSTLGPTQLRASHVSLDWSIPDPTS